MKNATTLSLYSLICLVFLLGYCQASESQKHGILFDCEENVLAIAKYGKVDTILIEEILDKRSSKLTSFGIVGVQGASMQLYLENTQSLSEVGFLMLDSLQGRLLSKYGLGLNILIDSTNSAVSPNIFRFLENCDSTTYIRVHNQNISVDNNLIGALANLSLCSFVKCTFFDSDEVAFIPATVKKKLKFENCVVNSEEDFGLLCDMADQLFLQNVHDSLGNAFVPELNRHKQFVLVRANCLDASHFQRMSRWNVATLSVFESCNELFPTALLEIEGIQGVLYRGQLTGFDDWSHIKYRDIALNLNGNQISDLSYGWEEHFAYNSLDNTLENNPLSERLVRELIRVHRSYTLPLGSWLLPYLEIRQK